jgi:hypothetical protein
MALNAKKIRGILYPCAIFTGMVFIYFALIVNPFFQNRRMFQPGFNLIYSAVYLTIFHVLFITDIYCYITCIFKNPGNPPKFWVT